MGLEAHGHKCVFASEIDKHAQTTYHANFGETPHGDITKIKSEDIPDHDILTGGFPCQSFSIAGKRGGFDDARGTLFFEIARIAKDKKPTWLFLENVPGLLSHDNGKTFQVIVATLEGLGYDLDWRILNTKDFGPPQNRRRLFIIGKLGANLFWKFDWPKTRPSGLVLRDILEDADDKYFLSRKLIDWKSTRKPEVGQAHRVYGSDENGPALNQGCHGLVHIATIGKDGQGNRVYSTDGTSTTLSSQGGGWGARTGLYKVDFGSQNRMIDIDTETNKQRIVRAGVKTTAHSRNGIFYGSNGLSPALASGFPLEYQVKTRIKQIGITKPNNSPRQDRQSNRIYSSEGLSPSLATTTSGGHTNQSNRIRRLTPRECARLQGFPETFKIPVSDSQAYKQFGNAVSVPVITAIGEGFK